MSRSGYSDDHDYDYDSIAMWRGAVASAVNGKRGQEFLKDLLVALDAKPEKTLAAEALKTSSGDFCTLGVIGALRGIDMPEDEDGSYTTEYMAKELDIAHALAAEIVYLNDEGFESPVWNKAPKITPEERFTKVRNWVANAIKKAPEDRIFV